MTKDGKSRTWLGQRHLFERKGRRWRSAGTDKSLQVRPVRRHHRSTRARAALLADPRANDPGCGDPALLSGDAVAGQALVPLGQPIDLGAGYRIEPRGFRAYTGLQYRYDPGMALVGLGALVLLAGLCISFYRLCPAARLYLKTDRLGTGTGTWRWRRRPSRDTMCSRSSSAFVDPLARNPNEGRHHAARSDTPGNRARGLRRRRRRAVGVLFGTQAKR